MTPEPVTTLAWEGRSNQFDLICRRLFPMRCVETYCFTDGRQTALFELPDGWLRNDQSDLPTQIESQTLVGPRDGQPG